MADYGVGGLAILALATYGLWKVYRDSKIITDKVEAIAEDVSTLRALIKHESGKGDPLLHYSILQEINQEMRELREDAEKHQSAAQKCHDDMERAANAQKFSDCDVNRCIYISRILDRFDDFDKRAEESRSSTITNLESINSKIIELGRENGDMARSIISVLSDFVTNKKRSGGS